jgi:hypothetical protein
VALVEARRPNFWYVMAGLPGARSNRFNVLLAKEIRISLPCFHKRSRLARFAFREFQKVRPTNGGLFWATMTPPFFTVKLTSALTGRLGPRFLGGSA